MRVPTSFGWSCVARIPPLMTPIALVAVVQQIRNDYTVAGLASGLFGAGMAVGAPVLGRLIQRYGQARVVGTASAACGLVLAGLALGEALRQPVASLLVLAGVAGALVPPFTAAMRAVWTALAADARTRSASFALDGVTLELLFVVGPILVSGALLIGPDVLALLAAAVLIGVGGVGYALTRPVRGLARGGPSAPTERGLFRRPGVPAVLVVASATAATMGAVDTALLAVAADDLGGSALIGPLIACIVAGSVVGGLVLGARAWPGTPATQSRGVQLGLAVLLVPIWAVVMRPGGPPLVLLGALLAVFGSMLAPCLILQQAVLDDLVPAAARLPAQAWLASGTTAGTALGTAMAGAVVELGGPVRALAMAVALTAAAAAAAVRVASAARISAAGPGAAAGAVSSSATPDGAEVSAPDATPAPPG
ncbi:MFS transporter [Cryptosporangium phraense]|uniref:MFS transporter n=1 Tax=Cryptosporangium phraense TaxID=2593070 RepID=A0A545APE7_9ACTN|nr:MFS transporter [Cryptosporangium phraense]TQS43176.1 MFS transporter [Cryptosporangium phraense]